MLTTKLYLTISENPELSLVELINTVYFCTTNDCMNSPAIQFLRRYRYSIVNLSSYETNEFCIGFHFENKKFLDSFRKELTLLEEGKFQ